MRQVRFKEAFGTSPGTIPSIGRDTSAGINASGTLQQLAANHVPTKSDLPSLRAWLDARDRGIRQMTGQPELIPCGALAPAYSMRLGAYA